MNSWRRGLSAEQPLKRVERHQEASLQFTNAQRAHPPLSLHQVLG